MKSEVLAGIFEGRPRVGPSTVHVDVTNGCNAACITCWDHSPLLKEPRPATWKKQRFSFEDFDALLSDLDGFGSMTAMILSGMGDPLVHPNIYEMIDQVKARGWHLTLLTNLLAADIDRLAQSGVDQLLVGVHGATPEAYTKFHPGWDESHFFTLCRYLRQLRSAGVTVRHVQVINRDTAPEFVAMISFAESFGAERVNYKLASLYGGTERGAITDDQRRWLLDEAIPAARSLAERSRVNTNLDLFERQVRSNEETPMSTTPIEEVGCFMGYVYTRITVEKDVLFCCNTAVRVGSLDEAPISELWTGPAWQALRDRLRDGRYFSGCDKCGKFEQNVKWSERVRSTFGADTWKSLVPRREAARLRVLP